MNILSETKEKMLNSYVISILAYGYKCWTRSSQRETCGSGDVARQNEGENTMNGICDERGSLKENRNKMTLSLTSERGSWAFLRHIIKK